MLKRKYKEHPLNIAFDIDDTLWKVRRATPNCDEKCKANDFGESCTTHKPKFDQIPDYDLIQVLRWFYYNGDNIFIWSAGGMRYAADIAKKLGLDEMVTIVAKKHDAEDDGDTLPPKMDIAFDDCETDLAKVDVRLPRPFND